MDTNTIVIVTIVILLGMCSSSAVAGAFFWHDHKKDKLETGKKDDSVEKLHTLMSGAVADIHHHHHHHRLGDPHLRMAGMAGIHAPLFGHKLQSPDSIPMGHMIGDMRAIGIHPERARALEELMNRCMSSHHRNGDATCRAVTIINEKLKPLVTGVVNAVASGGLKGVSNPVIRSWNPVAVAMAKRVKATGLVAKVARYGSAVAGPSMSMYDLREYTQGMRQTNPVVSIPLHNHLAPDEDALVRAHSVVDIFAHMMLTGIPPDVHDAVHAVDVVNDMFSLDDSQLSEIRGSEFKS